jgi:methionine biosynthesis protein MetW
MDTTGTSDKYHTFIEIIKKHSPKRFLDVGCGDGSFAEAIREEVGCEVFGIDISEEAIYKAKERGIEGVSLDIDSEDLPFENNFFDSVFCGEVIEHVYSPDNLLGELYRVLEPDGLLLLTTPNMASWFNRISLLFGYQPIFSDIGLTRSYGHITKMEPMGHLRLYTLKALTKLMEAYKFKILEFQGIGINYKIGFGKAHPVIARLANLLFKSPSLNSGILVLATKEGDTGVGPNNIHHS